MFTLSVGKILVVILVIVAAWKGLRLLRAVQRKLEEVQSRPPVPPRAAAREAEATELVPCPRCGTYVPNGTWCPSVEACTFKKS